MYDDLGSLIERISDQFLDFRSIDFEICQSPIDN